MPCVRPVLFFFARHLTAARLPRRTRRMLPKAAGFHDFVQFSGAPSAPAPCRPRQHSLVGNCGLLRSQAGKLARLQLPLKIITREATAIGRQKKRRMSYASWHRDQFCPLGHDHLCCHRGASDRVPLNALGCWRRLGLLAAPWFAAGALPEGPVQNEPGPRFVAADAPDRWRLARCAASNKSRWP